MKLSRLFLSLAGLAILFICVAQGWADRIPSKKPSDYGDPSVDKQLLPTPTSTTIQDGVTVVLDSVFCNSCSDTTTGGIAYFYRVNLDPSATLTSLTFGPGFNSLFDPTTASFAFVQFDPLDPGNAGNPCLDSSANYLCGVPFSPTTLNLSTVTTTVTCAADLSCTVDFTNFNFATLGGGPIIIAGSPDFGDGRLLDSSGHPTAPSVTINGGSTTTVPEPAGFWFAGIALAGLGLIAGKRKMMLPSAS